jgi:hypothetical protein
VASKYNFSFLKEEALTACGKLRQPQKLINIISYAFSYKTSVTWRLQGLVEISSTISY